MVSILAYGRSSSGFNFQHSPPKKFEGNIVDVAVVNEWLCLEKSGQWLENVY